MHTGFRVRMVPNQSLHRLYPHSGLFTGWANFEWCLPRCEAWAEKVLLSGLVIGSESKMRLEKHRFISASYLFTS